MDVHSNATGDIVMETDDDVERIATDAFKIRCRSCTAMTNLSWPGCDSFERFAKYAIYGSDRVE
jgi:hypothetical protein